MWRKPAGLAAVDLTAASEPLLEAVYRQGGHVSHEVDLAVGDDRRRKFGARLHGVGGAVVGGPQDLRATRLPSQVSIRCYLRSAHAHLHEVSREQHLDFQPRIYSQIPKFPISPCPASGYRRS